MTKKSKTFLFPKVIFWIFISLLFLGILISLFDIIGVPFFIFFVILVISLKNTSKFSKKINITTNPIENIGIQKKEIYGGQYITKNNEIVKSKSELFIADLFFEKGVKYIYEKELNLNGKIIHPDFYLIEYDLWIEFWGLTHIYEYSKNMKFKMAQYYKNNIRFVSLYPNDLFDEYHQKFDKKKLESRLKYKVNKALSKEY